MTKKALLIFVVFGFFVSGCAGLGSSVDSNVTVFHNVTEQLKGKSVVVLLFKKELENSLEFQNYKKIIENNLQKYGFNIVQEKGTSGFIAFVSYGIGGGKEELVSSPVFGSTCGGTTTFSGSAYNSGSGGSTSYRGSAYKMPTFGVVGSRTDSITTYTRQLAMDLVETSTLESKKVNKVYKGRVKSIGKCSTITQEMPHMMQSMFLGFPRRNGSSEKISIPSNIGC